MAMLVLRDVVRGSANVTRVETCCADTGQARVYYVVWSGNRSHGAFFADKMPALVKKLKRSKPGSPARDVYEALIEASEGQA